MVRITFYYKGGCWLCDTVEEMLNGLSERHHLEIKKVDISEDDALYELYRFDIPVLEFRDGSHLHGRIRKKDLLQKFAENEE